MGVWAVAVVIVATKKIKNDRYLYMVIPPE
jgi:hypothetical protein